MLFDVDSLRAGSSDSCKLKIIQAESCSDDLSTVLVEGVYDGESTIDGQFPDDAGMAVRWVHVHQL